MASNNHKFYEHCLECYPKTHSGDDEEKSISIYNLVPHNNIFIIPDDIIEEFANKVDNIFNKVNYEGKHNQIVKVDNYNIYCKSYDNKNIINLRIENIDGLINHINTINTYVKSYMEKKLGTFLLNNNCLIIRNLMVKCNNYDDNLKINNNKGTYLWHCDNNLYESFKILIYLNDVDQYSAPFEIIHNGDNYIKMIKEPGKYKFNGTQININNNNSKYWNQEKQYKINDNARVPINTINRLIDNGYTKRQILGTKYTAIPFQTGIIHKANFGTNNIRNALVLEYLPFNKDTSDMDLIELYKNQDYKFKKYKLI